MHPNQGANHGSIICQVLVRHMALLSQRTNPPKEQKLPEIAVCPCSLWRRRAKQQFNTTALYLSMRASAAQLHVLFQPLGQNWCV